jgi:hypothetical protein
MLRNMINYQSDWMVSETSILTSITLTSLGETDVVCSTEFPDQLGTQCAAADVVGRVFENNKVGGIDCKQPLNLLNEQRNKLTFEAACESWTKRSASAFSF